MNTDSVPICISVSLVITRLPPRHSTSAIAKEAVNITMEMKVARYRAVRMEVRFMSSVVSPKSRAILSSMTSVLVVFAPVMPSLKLAVICELISRTRRLSTVSLPWNSAAISVMMGVSATTHSASFQFIMNMTTMTPMR